MESISPEVRLGVLQLAVDLTKGRFAADLQGRTEDVKRAYQSLLELLQEPAPEKS